MRRRCYISQCWQHRTHICLLLQYTQRRIISSMLKPCILVDGFLDGGSGTLLRNMLVPAVGSAPVTVAEGQALCRSRLICRWGRCAGSGGGGGRIVYEDEDES